MIIKYDSKEYKSKIVEEGNPLCPRCKYHILEPLFSNVLKRIKYPLGHWKCSNCQAVYEFIKPVTNSSDESKQNK